MSPSHQDRVRENNKCPYCGGYLSDGKHNTARLGVNDYYSYLIGCPNHPRYPDMTMITKVGEKISE